jgi:hypothetical protein
MSPLTQDLACTAATLLALAHTSPTGPHVEIAADVRRFAGFDLPARLDLHAGSGTR